MYIFKVLQNILSFSLRRLCKEKNLKIYYINNYNYVSNFVSWNSLLGSVIGNGNLEAAARFFERFPKKNVVSYNTMIAGNAQAGELSSCFDLVAKMAIEGLTPDEQAFSVLAASSHGGKLEQGLHHFVLMSGDFEITALREHYDSVTDILGRAGNLELARSVVQAMPFLPAWGSLLGGYQMQSGQGFTQRAARSVSELGLGRANSHTKWYTNSRYIIDFKI
ncbi:hypothetical protein SELMODRAFT_78040 [Selaginella moellendorffii]|uniref:Pentacotripeptide-repeat region of PRORP domain-containing protein n=1 Tax=Selaginella moellendorffii TaxID=88036 RepID=D8QUG8_SELML|nr:hypothetical protein SELMODRAFT_78040 [Selaginella moellendorffii]